MGRSYRAWAGFALAVLACLYWSGAARAQTPTAADFQKVTLDDNTQNPMEIDVANDGRVFYIERDGRLQIWKPNTQQTVTAGTVPVTRSQENGLLGLQLAPDFDTSKWVYLFYSQLPDNTLTQVVSRFKVNGDTLDLTSEQKILTFQHQTSECCHSSGSLYFGPDGSLYISSGDNTNPFDSDGYNPIDERSGRTYWDAQRTAGNTNDLNGKIMRIKPLETVTGTPGVGTTYTIPNGNLFPESEDTDNKTRPEIFGMGFRNPFRFTVDPTTGWVLGADYGPDASTTNATRGPQGSVEYNVLTKAGNYGWPYCIRDNTAYNDFDFATRTSGAKFDCAAPVNNSPNNTGRTNLPPAIGASGWMGYTETDSRLPGLGTGGAPMGGPRYHFDANLASPRKFPAFYDNKWFIAEWNNGWIKTADLNSTGAMTAVQNFALGTGYKRPMDLDFGPDGALYVIEWGSGFNGDNADSGVYRIDYISGEKAPIARATGTPTAGLAPLTVQFSSVGSSDPENTAITYAWDFDSNGTVDSTAANPSYTYTTNGAFTAKLTVKDAAGLTAVANVPVTVGNRAPTIKIEYPEDGQFASFTDTIRYKITVTDPEDGTTGAGISCTDVKVTISLGHDEHAHDLSNQTGCEGTFKSGLTSGHGAEANTFTVLSVTYTDKGGPGGIVPLTGRAQAILQPKQKQAEFFASTGRVDDGTTAGDKGVTTETTTDTAGGGKNLGFVEDGDYVSYKPVNLKDTTGMRFRVASAGAGGTIEVRLDSPTGTLVGTTANITPTGDWQVFKDVSLDLASPPSGTHELFLVFRNRGSTQNLFNVNWFDVLGKGAATTAAPEASIVAQPTSGSAPLAVQFTTTATDPDGDSAALTYAWDFGVPGTDADVSTAKSPAYTYQQPGTYNAVLTVTDTAGGVTTKQVQITVNPSSECPTGYREDFNGTDVGSPWTVVRRDQTLTLSGGKLNLVAQAGDVYTTSNNAKNLVLQPAPAGPWTITTKINFKGLVQYQQAGLLIYGDDDNYTKFDRVATNGATANPVEKFEFINEVAGTPRNGSADATANLAAGFPDDYYLRVKSDGTNITGEYSTNGTTWTAVGQSAAQPANAKIGVFALSNAAATNVTAAFDYVTIEGPGVVLPFSNPGDSFTGNGLDKTRWNAIVREDATRYKVADGGLTATTVLGDIYTNSDATITRNFFLQTADHAGADYVLETKVTGTYAGGYSQGGIIVYGDDDNYVKLDAVSDQGQTRVNRFELRSEQAGAVLNPQPQITIPAGNTTFYLRLTKAGNTYSGEYSYDGTTWTSVGASVTSTLVAPRFGLFSLAPQAVSVDKTVTFDYFKVNGSMGCGGTSNISPVITSATATPSAGIAPLQVALNAAATDADGDTLTYSWDFDGNGTADATGATASTTFTTAGNKTVKLTVSDGKTGTATKDIPVQVLAADDTSKRLRALVFSKTAAFRHDAIPAGIAAVQSLGNQYSYQVDATEDASLFRDDVLSHYDVVIWMSTTGDVLTDTQQAAFERFIKAGGGYAGVHSSTDTEYTWPWYGQLVGAYFRNHPAGTPTATVVREDKTDPSTVALQDRWQRTDEWYNYQSPVNPVINGGGVDYSPRATSGTHVLLTMDESTYAEDDGTDGTDDDHPISWCRKFDGGRMWYTGMGHTQASYSEADFLKHLQAGIEIAAGVQTSNACGIVATNHDPTVSAQRNPTGDVNVDDPVAFTATGADSDNDTLTYAWDFGDGATASTKSAMHAYSAAGAYVAKVTVSDGKGGTASATLGVVVKALNEVSTPVDVGGTVPGVLALNIAGSGSLGTFLPGIARDYTSSLAATATSTASAAALTVRDPSATATGHLVNGTAALRSPLQVRATDAANPDTAYAPLSETGARVNLLAFPAPTSARALTIGFKQSIAADEPLVAGGYGKTVVFTLSATTP